MKMKNDLHIAQIGLMPPDYPSLTALGFSVLYFGHRSSDLKEALGAIEDGDVVGILIEEGPQWTAMTEAIEDTVYVRKLSDCIFVSELAIGAILFHMIQQNNALEAA